MQLGMFPRMSYRNVFFIITFCFLISACVSQHTTDKEPVMPLLPPGVTYPPMTAAQTPGADKVNLGRHLFFDRRLSFNQTKSCAGCHAPQFAFTDGYRRSFGATADLHQRNAQPLFNLVFLERLTAANPALSTPEQQMANPLFNTKFIEMGIKDHEAAVLNRFRNNKEYQILFQKAFPENEDAVRIPNIIAAIAAFSRTLVSAGSAYDRYRYYGDSAALGESAKRGMQLFFSEALNCTACHNGFNFSGGLNVPGSTVNERIYFNTGLYNTNGLGAYPAYDEGLKEFTGKPADMGKFRIPSLRNLVFTGPYMHDGSIAALPEVIDMYARGGRLITQGADRGDGSKNPFKDARIKGFSITPQQKSDLVSFLFSLTDSSFVNNPKYQNPFKEDETKGY